MVSATFPARRGASGKGTDISIDGRVYFPHSLGIFYQALTQYLGFPHYGDEYKVMGLAPYGSPSFMDAMRKIVRLKVDGTYSLDLAYFRHHRERIVLSVDGWLTRIWRSVCAGTRGIAWAAPLGPTIRSTSGIAISRARFRLCTRRPSFT